jgi:hypothetical protein
LLSSAENTDCPYFGLSRFPIETLHTCERMAENEKDVGWILRLLPVYRGAERA